MNRRGVVLTVTVVIELLALCAMARLGDLRAHLWPFLILFAVALAACLIAWRLLHARPVRLAMLLSVALALRIPMLLTEPSLSDDVWRYLHDGRAQMAGVNPYAFAPANPQTALYRGPEFSRINHPGLHTIYPPVAQITFALNALLGPHLLAWRLLLVACELLVVLALFRLGAGSSNLVLYAWHPLAVIEVAGSAHLEPVAIALLLLGLLAAQRHRDGPAGLLIGLSTATKFIAAPVLLVTGMARTRWAVAALGAALLLPYALYWNGGSAFGSLGSFAVHWQSNASVYAILAALTDGHRARILCATLLLCVMATLMRSTRPPLERAAWFVFALLLLAPVAHPWYVLWLLAFVPVMRAGWLRLAALAWSGSVVLAYADLVVAEYLPVYAALTAAMLARSEARSADPLEKRTPQTDT